MNALRTALTCIVLLPALLSCAWGPYPVRSVQFETVDNIGTRTARSATPEQVAFLQSWIEKSQSLPFTFGKVESPDVTGVIVVLLKAHPDMPPSYPAELFLQVDAEHVVIHRKGAHRFRLSTEEMLAFRQSLGLPPPAQR